MRKVLKIGGIVLTLVVVLAVLMTSVAMAAGPYKDYGTQIQNQTCEQSQDCIYDCEQTQTRTCTQSQDCTCISDQTQTQIQNAGELSQVQTQTKAGELSQTQTQNTGDLSPIQTQAGEPSKTQTKTRAGKV